MAKGKPVNRTRTNIRSICGTLNDTNGTTHEILLDDGDLKSTHELLEFKIWPVNAVTTVHYYLQGSTMPAVGVATNRAEIPNQYAWTGYVGDSGGLGFHHYEVTNDGALFVDNVYINCIGTGTGAQFNYRLRLRETISSDFQGIIGLIKQHSQDMDDE
jgi:hypothetical protein